jgi:glucose/arabinose dehydrogenase
VGKLLRVRAAAVFAAMAAPALLTSSCASVPAEEDSTPAIGEAPAGAEPRAGAAPGDNDGSSGTLFNATQIASLPATVTGLVATPDGQELLISDRQGHIWRMTREESDGWVAPRLEPQPILDVSDRVSLLGERGMFSLALVDDGHSLLVNFTALNGAITIEQYPYRPGEPLDPARARVVAELRHPYAWHHGGGMALDDEGNVYVGVGDMEFRQLGVPGPQDPDLLLGGVVRIPASALDGSDADWRLSPADLVAKGLRNPWRLSLDRPTGDLWIGEVGLDQREEVNVIRAAELGGGVTNFGWPYFEGTVPHQGTPPDGRSLADPFVERAHGDGACGMVGGFVYRGDRIPDLSGRYVYGDLCGSDLRAVSAEAAEGDGPVGELPETIVSLGEDHLGELYALGAMGGVYRLDPAGWVVAANEQAPAVAVATTTTVPRSRLTCDGIVGLVEPLAEIGAMGPSELEQALTSANEGLVDVVPLLPGYLLEDGLIVQNLLIEYSEILERAGWDWSAPEVESLRRDTLEGTGSFSRFPEAMARIVDSECG